MEGDARHQHQLANIRASRMLLSEKETHQRQLKSGIDDQLDITEQPQLHTAKLQPNTTEPP
ncbi:18146_t:CDS:2 [Gigaspora margarita]|uniref:18146_t:CDS:1 n=1 Tax=Gigaspora margarita TaxID=4874 RepID=A0ABN7UP09_GIGMA|nr:18146_t:CDS:2 [Gigaspora margarita]